MKGLWLYSYNDYIFINPYSWRHQWRHQVTKQVKFWNCYISINIPAGASIKSSKYRNCSCLFCWHIQLPVSLPVTKCVATSKLYFQHFELSNTASIWPQLWEDRPKLCYKMYLSWWWRYRWPPSVTWNLPSIFMFSRGWHREQVARAMFRQ